MKLSAAQRTTLKTHLAANTNVATRPNSTTFTINVQYVSGDPTDEQAIADWYNAPATAGDSQPFANLNLWNPQTGVAALKRAIDWANAPPHGLSGSPTVDQQQLAINNQWWRWDAMLRDGALDMSDPQVRAGVLQVWGNVAGSASNIGAIGCGKQAGTRFELALAGPPVGASAPAWTAAHVCPSNVISQILTQDILHDAILNG